MDQRNYLSVFFDVALSIIMSQMTCYAVISLFESDRLTALVASLVLAVCFSALWNGWLSSRKKKRDYSQYRELFVYRSREQNADFICSALSKRYDCELIDGKIITDSCDVIPIVRYSPLYEQEAIDIALNSPRKTLIIAVDASPKCDQALAKTGKSVSILRFDGLCEWLDMLGALPALPTKKRKSAKAVFSQIFARKNSGKLFRCGLVLIALSTLTSMRAYYVFFAVALIIAAAAAKISELAEKHSFINK